MPLYAVAGGEAEETEAVRNMKDPETMTALYVEIKPLIDAGLVETRVENGERLYRLTEYGRTMAPQLLKSGKFPSAEAIRMVEYGGRKQ